MITKWLSRAITGISSSSSNDAAVAPYSADRAFSLEKQGAYGEALKIYHELLTSDENNLDAHLGLGRIYGRMGEYDKAISHLEKVIQHPMAGDEAYYYLGNVYKLLGDADKAIINYRQALSINPVNMTACGNLCRMLLKEKRISEIIQHLKPALEIRPIPFDILFVLGSVYKEAKDYKKAYHFFRKAYSADPDSLSTLKELVTTQITLEKYQEAVKLSERAVQQHPDSAKAFAILGYAYLKSDMFEPALDCFDKSLEISPDDYSVHNNRGITLQYIGQIDEAIACYEKAHLLNKDHKKTLFYKSLAYLTKGDFTRGWRYYQYRTFPHTVRNVTARYENCDLNTMKPKRMLIHSEQGLGDEIMFASCIPDVLSCTDKCYIECDDKLVDLFRNSFPDAEIIPGSELARSSAAGREPLEVDCQIAIGDLPGYFRKSLDDFTNHGHYLKAGQERIGYWREKLSGLGKGRKIGLSWMGGTVSTHRRRRSITLEKLLPILELDDVQFVSLQYTECREEIDALEQEYGVHIHHWQEAIDNYSDTAALISALDLVITVQTAVAHLSGALGREVWMLLNSCPEWRYMITGESLPWYPSATLFRQDKQGDWDGVVTRVRNELQGYINNGAKPLKQSNS